MPARDLENADVPTLSLAERDRRWNLAHAFMERENLEALIVLGEHEDAGAGPFSFDTWFTNDRAGMTVILSRNGQLTAFVPMSTYINSHLAASRRRCQLDHARADPRGSAVRRHREGAQ